MLSSMRPFSGSKLRSTTRKARSERGSAARSKARRLLLALLTVGAALGSVGCVSHDPPGVRSVAQRQLKCAPDDVYAVINRTTPRVQEWIVGCEFYYTRVLCSANGCQVPTPKPPCFGDQECFEEDPMTLEWTLPRTASR